MSVCLRVYTECVTECSGAKAGIVQEVKGKHRCAEVLFCSRKLYSLTCRSQRSHGAEKMALIGKGAAGFPRVAADPNAHFIITQADTDIYLHRAGMAEEFGAMLPRRSEAWFIEWKSHKQTTEQVPGSSHSRTRAHIDAHRHPHLYAPECCRNTLSQVWSLFAVASRIKRVKRDAR